MSLLEQIDKKDIERVIAYSQDIASPKVDELLLNWATAKAEISHRYLNGKTSYTYPSLVHFELSEQSKRERLIDFISNIFDDYYHPLVKFLNSLSVDEFYSNRLNEDYVIELPTEKKISHGTKVVKSFKYFIEEEKLLQDLQNKASELIQENKIEGYLTFSIHPLDFLSSSENTYNWRSCHALDGEYRAGNLSYMCDRGTMIVYLSGTEQMRLPHFPPNVLWNSKKWRVLLHFDQSLDICFAGRQYPFFSPGGLDTIFNIFTNEMVPYCSGWGFHEHKREKWVGWFNDYIESFDYRNSNHSASFEIGGYCVINGGIYDKFQIVQDAPNSLHFNDVTRSSCYDRPYYMFKRYWGKMTDINFLVGSAVKCLRCGEELIRGDDSMMCPECECKYGNSNSDAYRVCDCCGSRFWYEEGTWIGEDDFVCDNCYHKETFTCEDCGERYYNADKHWNEELSGYICTHCHNERNES